ncbi:MAG: UPF0280 family protein [Reyranellaceae bacterium]
MSGPRGRFLPDGQRLHLQHGPIDLIVEAFGRADEVEAAYRQAWQRFQSILQELVDELARLRQPLTQAVPLLRGATARRMLKATLPFRPRFITPMAAVAGAVADEVMAAMTENRHLHKAYVNNGGDIALHLTTGHALRAGVVTNQDMPALDAFTEIKHEDAVRGMATSGWRGRSLSLGIVDAVTVLAATAAAADAAATMIANAVNAEHPAIERMPASAVRDDSDLGDLLVTTTVGDLPRETVDRALSLGLEEAERLQATGLIDSAFLALQTQSRVTSACRNYSALPGRRSTWN